MKNYFNNLCEDIKCVSKDIFEFFSNKKYLIILIALLTYIINCFIFTALFPITIILLSVIGFIFMILCVIVFVYSLFAMLNYLVFTNIFGYKYETLCFTLTALIGIIIFIIGFIIAYNEIFYDIINNIKQLS